MDNKPANKVWYESKTLWFNIASIAFMVVQAVVQYFYAQQVIADVDYEDLTTIGKAIQAYLDNGAFLNVQASIVALVNIVLRAITNQGVVLKKENA